MAGQRVGVLAHDLRGLFGAGTAAGLTDGELLERFVSRRGDERSAAFAALVERHGPMVLGVCQRILTDPEDVNDAFQATFLVLVERAGAVRVEDSLGRWLHGVSVRVAGRVRSRAVRRRRCESACARDPGPTPCEVERRDLRAVLDDELERLPEKYRLPVVLCYLDGLTHEGAAGVQGWPVGTVRGRLARARVRLRDRLSRRGLAPAAGFLVGGTPRVPISLSPALARSTVQAMSGGPASSAALAIAKGVVGGMVMGKLKLAVATLLMLGTLATVVDKSAGQGTRDSRSDLVMSVAAQSIAEEDSAAKSTVPAGAKLVVTQTGVPDSVGLGDPVEFRIKVANQGDSRARNVVVMASLSPGLAPDPPGIADQNVFELPLGDLDRGMKAELEPLVVRVVGTGEQSCTVEARSEGGLGTSLESRSIETVRVTGTGLSLWMSDPKVLPADKLSTYTITVFNWRKEILRNVSVKARIPEGIELAALPSHARFDDSARVLTWEIPRLEPGESGKVQLSFDITLGSSRPGRITAMATDGTLVSNVVGGPELDLKIRADRPAIDIGQSGTLSIQVRNRGFREVKDLRISLRHSRCVKVTRTAGSDIAATFAPQDSREIRFPSFDRLAPGKDLHLGIEVQGQSQGDAGIRVFLRHDDSDAPLEDTADITVSQPR